MLLLDANVLLYAFRTELPEHAAYRQWLNDAVARESALGLADIVLSEFLRIATNSRIFRTPTPIESALSFVESLRAQPASVVMAPGPRHWTIFANLCRQTPARGNLITDAYLAALAIESGSELISADHDFARFAGLHWRLPF